MTLKQFSFCSSITMVGYFISDLMPNAVSGFFGRKKPENYLHHLQLHADIFLRGESHWHDGCLCD